MSVQCAAVASQKFTWPAGTAAAPAVTVAVKVAAVPADIEVTDPVLEVIASVVVVVVEAALAGTVARRRVGSRNTRRAVCR
jgi:hypothetical protein